MDLFRRRKYHCPADETGQKPVRERDDRLEVAVVLAGSLTFEFEAFRLALFDFIGCHALLLSADRGAQVHGE